MRTNQFSVTKHHKGVNPWAGGSGLPGVFFMYDLSPMLVQITEHRRSFFHFLTGVCAIVGGVFTGKHKPLQTGTVCSGFALTNYIRKYVNTVLTLGSKFHHRPLTCLQCKRHYTATVHPLPAPDVLLVESVPPTAHSTACTVRPCNQRHSSLHK